MAQLYIHTLGLLQKNYSEYQTYTLCTVYVCIHVHVTGGCYESHSINIPFTVQPQVCTIINII